MKVSPYESLSIFFVSPILSSVSVYILNTAI